MQNTKNQQQPQQQEEETDVQNTGEIPENAAVEDDGTPVLDESDLEENNLSDEEADKVEWDKSEE